MNHDEMIKFLEEKLISKEITSEWTGKEGHQDCVSFHSELFKEPDFFFYIPSMAWEGIESYFAKEICKYIEEGELHLL